MTCRVVDCHTEPPPALPRREDRPPRAHPRAGLGVALLTALVLVPLAGAAEPPAGWLAASLATAGVVLVCLVVRGRAPWGWLTVLLGSAGIVLPRGPYPAIGPALLVACALSGVFWLARRREPEHRGRIWPSVARERIAQQHAGRSGEIHVGQVLADALPPEFTLLNGLKLPRGAGDIDHLIVGPTGLFLLETKTMAGQIVCTSQGIWQRTKTGRAGTRYSAFIGDPAAQVQRNIRAVRECLHRSCPDLARRTQLWIEGVVVFPHPAAELHAEHSRIPALRLDETPARIVGNAPRRRLNGEEVEVVVSVLLHEVNYDPSQHLAVAQPAQALVELALALPVVLSLLFGTLALSRLLQAQTAVVAIAHESARAGALARNPSEAASQIVARAESVAPGFGIDPRTVVVDWDVSQFGADPGRVTAQVRYTVHFDDLPLGGWVPVTLVRSEHVEVVDPYRSGVAAVVAGTR
jgi:hypothetical protein